MQDSARAVLLEHLRISSRGRLVVRDRDVEVSVFVQDGALLTAQSDDDGKRLLDRLQREGLLDDEVSARLDDVVARVPGVGPLLDAVAADVLAGPLHDRFEDDLLRFLAADGDPTFEAMGTVFVDNPQRVDDPAALLDRLSAMLDEMGDLDVESEVALGLEVPTGPREQRIALLVEQGTTRIAEILERVPEEPIAGRVLVAQMIGRGELVPGQHALRHRTPATPIQRSDDDLSLRELGLPIDPGTADLSAGQQPSLPADWSTTGHRTPAPVQRATPSALHPRASRMGTDPRSKRPSGGRPSPRVVGLAIGLALVVLLAIGIALVELVP
jgi:hypothetical protein